MAKVLIIDGYNIIGALGRMRRDREMMERERLILLRNLEVYAGGSAFSEIILVFDGYPTDRDLALVRSGVVRVCFSEGARDADTVIVELSRRYRERAAVVSSDREVVQAVTASGSESISAQRFLSRFSVRIGQESLSGRTPPESGYGKDEDPDGAPPSSAVFRKKKGNPHRLSKKERAEKRLFDKL